MELNVIKHTHILIISIDCVMMRIKSVDIGTIEQSNEKYTEFSLIFE